MSDEIKLSNIGMYPILVNPETLNKFKKLVKEEIIGVQDAFILFVSILQWNTLGGNWDLDTILDELGFPYDYAEELINFMIEQKLISMR